MLRAFMNREAVHTNFQTATCIGRLCCNSLWARVLDLGCVVFLKGGIRMAEDGSCRREQVVSNTWRRGVGGEQRGRVPLAGAVGHTVSCGSFQESGRFGDAHLVSEP